MDFTFDCATLVQGGDAPVRGELVVGERHQHTGLPHPTVSHRRHLNLLGATIDVPRGGGILSHVLM